NFEDWGRQTPSPSMVSRSVGASPVAGGGVETGYPTARGAWYNVIVLPCAYIFSFIDRQILNLLVAPVRRDLAISDTQMSLLIGFSFAIFYSVLGLPFGRLADWVSRPRLIIAG